MTHAIPPPIQAAKWLSVQALLSRDEMQDLMNSLGEFSLYPTHAVYLGTQLTKDYFLEVYAEYIRLLTQGELPADHPFRSLFSSIWTTDISSVATIPMGEKQLCRAIKPIVQLQYHTLGYSPLDGKFRSMVMGSGSIPWGIQFSYPQLFQEPITQKVIKVDPSFPNTTFYQQLRRWIRDKTLPTPFLVNGQQINVPARIGKECFSWINKHPQFKNIGIQVKEGRHEY